MGEAAGLEKEIETVMKRAQASDDSYLIALTALILKNSKREEEADSLIKLLLGKQDETGKVTGAKTSITRSSGKSLDVETTALATLAFLGDSKFSGSYAAGAENGVKFIVSSIKDGSYGSTQATVLALKVLVVYLKSSKMTGSGTFVLSINGEEVKSFTFDNTSKSDTIDFTNDTLTWLKPRFANFKGDSSPSIKLEL
jgi:alpha-2-macroglobulin-like protein